MEQASTQERGFALAPALQQAYIRRLDVVNRGFSGYNTDQALRVLPKIMPDPEQTRVRLMVRLCLGRGRIVLLTKSKAILFGSNDACFSEAQNGQHVPLDKYKKNLVKLLSHPAVEAHKPRLLLVNSATD
ncbi:MAG: hypothetical protein M1813_004618 [Trichoglossum hirsutum]|nr:MAG: hypothetical protein M1813_004618 [Trichoglossum hirsutum]